MIYSDGGARGNPGPAAIAFIIKADSGEILAKRSNYIGSCTNNQAEYKALLSALEVAVALKAETIVCHSDSELIVRQLNGEYRVRNNELRILWQKVQEMRGLFREVKIVNVPRSHQVIAEVDELVNIALDEKSAKG